MNCGVAINDISNKDKKRRNKKPGWLNAKPGLKRVSDLAEFIERPQAEANQR
jgi:hypothetical protein